MGRKTWYWICQILGWGVWPLLQIFIAYNYAKGFLTPDEKKVAFFLTILSDFIWFILVSHLLRLVIKKMNWLNFSPRKVVIVFTIGVTSTALLSYYGSFYTMKASGRSIEDYERRDNLAKAQEMEREAGLTNIEYFNVQPGPLKDSTAFFTAGKILKTTGWKRDAAGEWKYEEQRKGREFWSMAFNFILLALWLLVYFVWHFVDKNRKDQLDKLRLEGLVNSLELKTIKSHINPHFIFNALNSIRALVDENPVRARKAITELSNILRSSLKAESLETVPLEQELDIVKDYLALEQMRFEERLRIEHDIDPETLSQPVPPMMIQTLVENAIKHGISKSIKGGKIRIASAFKNNCLEMSVQNTGRLTQENNTMEGFGLKGTRDRLKILYQNKATFEIENIGDQMVESRILMPIMQTL